MVWKGKVLGYSKYYHFEVGQKELFMTSASAGSAADYAGTWNLDVAQTSIEFHTKAIWIFNVKGTAKALSGTGTVSADGSVEGTFVIDATSIDTKNKKRDAHLQTDDFFDTAKYPTIDFAATSGRLLESGQGEVSGSLTIHGQTRPITVVGNLEHDETSATLRTEVDDLDRMDWGLSWTKMGAGTHNRIVIKAHFTKGSLTAIWLPLCFDNYSPASITSQRRFSMRSISAGGMPASGPLMISMERPWTADQATVSL